MPFMKYAKCSEVTIENLKNTAFYGVLYLITNYIWPSSYALSDEFYLERSFLYRLFYVWPTFFIFCMRFFIGATLSECVCTCAGFGAYPDDANVTNGEGPRVQYEHLQRDAEKHSYNFHTIVNLRAHDNKVCMTMREVLKNWNVCVQYWLAVNIYKQFTSKKYRTIVTLLILSFWHGFMPGHYFCIMGALFYVPIEHMLTKLYHKDATGREAFIVTSTLFTLSYLGMAIQLLTFKEIWFYYSSVYHIGFWYWAVLMVFSVVMTNKKRAADKKKKRALEKTEGTATAGDVSSQPKEKVQ